MNIRTESKTNRVFKLDDGRELTTAPLYGQNNAWEIVPHKSLVQLTEQEERKATAHGYDLKKVLSVKRKLSEGYSPMEVHKITGYARSTVYNYKNILETPLENDTKIQVKDSKKTDSFKCVLSNLLIIIQTDNQTTLSTFYLILPLFMVLFAFYFKYKYDLFLKARLTHRLETSFLLAKFTEACNISYRREPIICNSKQEEIYFKNLLKYYNNQGRDVFILKQDLNETHTSHWQRKEAFRENYQNANGHIIEEGQKNLDEYWDEITEKGMLDFFYYPKGENWQESKWYLSNAVQYLLDNPSPLCTDKARTKYLVNIIPNDYVKLQEEPNMIDSEHLYLEETINNHYKFLTSNR